MGAEHQAGPLARRVSEKTITISIHPDFNIESKRIQHLHNAINKLALMQHSNKCLI